MILRTATILIAGSSTCPIPTSGMNRGNACPTNNLFLLACLSILMIASGCGLGCSTGELSTYAEDLTIQRLGSNHVSARFVFRSRWNPQERHRCQDHEDWSEDMTSSRTARRSSKLCHFEAVFPRAVGVLLDRFKARY